MKNGKLKTDLEYIAVRALVGTLGALPQSVSIFFGRACGHLAYRLAGGLRRVGKRNLKLAYSELDEQAREKILRGCFENLGRQLGVFSHLPKTTRENLGQLVEYDGDGVKYLDEAKARGRGIIFLTGHLGAWELLNFVLAALHEPLSFLVRPIDNPRVESYVEGIRSRSGNTPIDKKAAARTALRILQKGGLLAVLADSNSQPREGVFVPFFGHLACTTAGVTALALKTDATVLPVCTVWNEERKRFLFQGGPIVELVRTGDRARDLELNTANFTAALEKLIRKYPDQWLWIHKRWKTRPEGEADLYARDAKIQIANSKFQAAD